MLHTRLRSCVILLFATVPFLLAPACANGQWYNVDCSGNTPGAYTSINSVLPLLTDGAQVQVTGPCTENVTIAHHNNLWIGAAWGQTATLQGNLRIEGVQNLFLYGLNVTNPHGDGIDISTSSGVELDACTSSNNGNAGLSASDSIVTLQNGGAYNNNGNTGVSATGAGRLTFSASASPIAVSNNVNGGISLQDGLMWGQGNLIVSNNTAMPGSNPQQPIVNESGYGILFHGHARAVFYVWDLSIGPNVISGNQGGGISIDEGSEISLSGSAPSGSGPWQTNVLDGNGPVGISVGLGSQLTLFNGVQITNHPDAGIDAYGHSQVFIGGDDRITNNGTGPASIYPTHAGVRVDGNSEALIRGGQISQNGGPGILALTNSSIDISGATLTSNLGGSIVCDSSSWLVSDHPEPGESSRHASPCQTPNQFGPHMRAFSPPGRPDFSRAKAHEAKYRALMSSH